MIDEIIRLYKDGLTINEISKLYNKSYGFVRNKLVKSKTEIRNQGDRKRTDNFDEKYFTKIDCQEKAYFIGFIAADGYIHSNGYKLVFNLNIKDREILEKFCSLTGCSNVISESKVFDKRTKKYYNKVSLQVCSKKFVKTLEKYGLDNNKTKNYIIKNIPKKYIKDCIRGLMDGDGSIYKNGVSLITTKENIDFLKSYLTNIKICDYIDEIQKDNNVYKMYLYKDRKKFLDHIYCDASIYLNRKYKRYLEYKG